MSLRTTIQWQNHLTGNSSKYYFPAEGASTRSVECPWTVVLLVLRAMDKNLDLCSCVSHKKKCRLSHEFPKFEPWLKKLDMPTAKHGAMIRKQAHVHECGGRIKENYWWLWNSKKQDVLWPPDQVGHALWSPPDQTVQQDSFAMSKISPLLTLINQLNDLEGLWVFYYLIQNLRI